MQNDGRDLSLSHRASGALYDSDSPVLESSIDSAHELELDVVRREGKRGELHS